MIIHSVNVREHKSLHCFKRINGGTMAFDISRKIEDLSRVHVRCSLLPLIFLWHDCKVWSKKNLINEKTLQVGRV